MLYFFFFFNDTATTEIYTLSLHDALPISIRRCRGTSAVFGRTCGSGARTICCRSGGARPRPAIPRSEEHTSELQSPCNLVCRLLLEKKKKNQIQLYLCRDHIEVHYVRPAE